MKLLKDRYTIIYIMAVCVMIVMFPIFMLDGHNKTQKKNNALFFSDDDRIHGIDISHHNGEILWHEVARHKFMHKPLDFVIIKATEGTDFIDPQFQVNWQGAKDANLIRGAYHFFNQTSDPVLQATNYLNTVKFETGDFVPVLDLEVDSKAIINGKNLIERAYIWLDIVEDELKHKPIIYTSHSIYNKYLRGTEHDYHIWLADYSVYATEHYNIDNLIMWQHSDGGKIPGIQRPVDLNVFYGSPHRFQKFIIKE